MTPDDEINGMVTLVTLNKMVELSTGEGIEFDVYDIEISINKTQNGYKIDFTGTVENGKTVSGHFEGELEVD